MRTISGIAVSPGTFEALQGVEYDLGIFAVGYEGRATFAAKALGGQCRTRAAIGFVENRAKRYYPNLRWFSSNDYIVAEPDEASFARALSLLVDRLEGSESCRVLVDISSSTRVRIASTLLTLRRLANRVNVEVDFVYSPSRFATPQKEDGPIVSAGPVTPEFAGWSANPDAGAIAIIGLGYEPRRAAGSIEFLEPSEVWTFVPMGADERFRIAVQLANRDLSGVVSGGRVLEYEVEEPYETFLMLESLATRVRERGQPVLVPFGPKIFNLCCLLVAMSHGSDLAVWRVSSGRYHWPQDRRASGKIVVLKASFTSV